MSYMQPRLAACRPLHDAIHQAVLSLCVAGQCVIACSRCACSSIMCMPTSLGCAEADCLPCRAVLQGAAEQDVDATVAFDNEDCHETQLQTVDTAEGQVAGTAAPSAGSDDGTASPASTAAPTPLPTAGGTQQLPSCCLLILPSATLGGLTSAGAGRRPVASPHCHLPALI